MHHRLPRPRRPFPNTGRRLLAGAMGAALAGGAMAAYSPALALQDQSTPPSAADAPPAPGASSAQPAPKPSTRLAPKKPASPKAAPTPAPPKPAPPPPKPEPEHKSAPALPVSPALAIAPVAKQEAGQNGEGWHTLAYGAGLAAALAALLAGGLALAARRGKPEPDEPQAETPPPQEPEPAPQPEPAPARHGGFQPSPMFANIPEDPAPPAEAPPAPAITLEPQRFITTLAQASLRYSLRIDNLADEPLGPLAITVALLSPDSAHAADAPDEGEVHRLILLYAGGTAQFSGEARLPLGAIKPVMLADMRLFVPLLRVEVEARRVGEKAALPALAARADFLVGAAQGGDGLAPFRLDDGPVTANRLIAHRQS